jgi:gluconolactonase
MMQHFSHIGWLTGLGILFCSCTATHKHIAIHTSCETLLDGLQWGEGPCLLNDGRILFADIPAQRTMCWSTGNGASLWRESAGLANGHAVASDGSVYACEEGSRRLVHLDSTGKILNVLCTKDANGKRLNSPNDLVLNASNTRLYFTDPTFGIRAHPELKEQPLNSVFSCTLNGDDLQRETWSELLLPNGIALSPCETYLYVADSKAGCILRYTVLPSGHLGQSQKFIDQGADGVRVDHAGRIYLACDKGICIYQPNGQLLITLPLEEGATNLCFDPKNPSTLFVTTPARFVKLKMALPLP